MSLIDTEVLHAAPLETEPFAHIVAPRLVSGGALKSVLRDFPKIDRPGSVPLSALEYGPAFAELVEALRGPQVATVLSERFAIDLQALPTMVTVRGRCRARDGQIHTDSKDKVVTVLLYLIRPGSGKEANCGCCASRGTSRIMSPKCHPKKGPCWRSNVPKTLGTAISPSRASDAPFSSIG